MSDITIVIKTIRGDATNITISSNATIADLKDQVEKTMNIPASEQKLIFNGRIMSNENVLSESGLLFIIIFFNYFYCFFFQVLKMIVQFI